MALMYLPFAILVFSSDIIGGKSVSNFTSQVFTPTKPILDPKRRNDLVEEAFLEQKDILLDMLEAKLKEVQKSKKKKKNEVENGNAAVDTKCEFIPNNVDLNLKGSGIVGVGETDIKLNFGESGNSTLNLNATGISNVGKIHLNLDIGDGSIYIPGLNNLLNGSSALSPCVDGTQTKVDKGNDSKNEKNEVNLDTTYQSRRSLGLQNEVQSENVTSVLSTETVFTNQNDIVNEETTTLSSWSTDDQVPTKINDENKDANDAAAAAAAAAEAFVGRRGPPPLLRSRTLPAIIAPGFSILHAQIDPQRTTGKL
ncbi:unnamed protein product [Euphydryas editha]|uniref:Uncharacterized protein n=1 Tax=Euphydryas editha TaxID=104508 RepID=A0AAU9V7D1_EUPED|nr:unnamed protein product [Euphydryas editha]